MTRSRSRFASDSFIPLIVRQSSTDAFGDMRSWRPEHFTVRSGSKPVTEYPRSGIPFFRLKLRGAPVLELKTLWGTETENIRFPARVQEISIAVVMIVVIQSRLAERGLETLVSGACRLASLAG